MIFGRPRVLLGATALAAFALTRCGPDSKKTDESSDDSAATGGLDGEGGKSATGGVSGAAGAGGSNAWVPCPNPRMPAMLGGSGNSDSFDTTEAVCFRVTDTFNAWGCRNLGNRTVRVNGVAVTCSETLGTWPLPERVDGAYYFEFTAGTPDNTSFYWYRV